MHKLVCVCVWVCLPSCVCVCVRQFGQMRRICSATTSHGRQESCLINRSAKAPTKSHEREMKTRKCVQKPAKSERTQYSWNSRWVFPFLFFLRRICVDLALRCWKIIKFTYKSCILIYMYYMHTYTICYVYIIYIVKRISCVYCATYRHRHLFLALSFALSHSAALCVFLNFGFGLAPTTRK